MSIKLKSYAPFVTISIAASGADFFKGMEKCQHLSDKVKEYQYEIALREAKDKGEVV